MITDEATVIDSIRIQQVKVSAYTIPTDAPEADGTLRWHSMVSNTEKRKLRT